MTDEPLSDSDDDRDPMKAPPEILEERIVAERIAPLRGVGWPR